MKSATLQNVFFLSTHRAISTVLSKKLQLSAEKKEVLDGRSPLVLSGQEWRHNVVKYLSFYRTGKENYVPLRTESLHIFIPGKD